MTDTLAALKEPGGLAPASGRAVLTTVATKQATGDAEALFILKHPFQGENLAPILHFSSGLPDR